MRFAFGLLLSVIIAISVTAQTRPRGRELGIPFPGTTGPLNAITDVPGIAVGHVTLIEGEGKLVPGKGPIARASRQFSRVHAVTGILSSQRRSIKTATAT